MSRKLHEETVSFTLNGLEFNFQLIHNFHVLYLDIYKDIEEWANQTSEYTIDSFCYFVLGQEAEERLICYPAEKWHEFENSRN